MVYVPVQCPHCHNTEVIKAGKQANGAQRYQCHNGQGERRIFLLQDQDRGRVPEIQRQVVALALNGSGIRDTARGLRISPTTVSAVLKKSPHASTRHPRVAAPSLMPLSIMFHGKLFDEPTVLRVAYAYERATEWNRKRPPIGIAPLSGAKLS